MDYSEVCSDGFEESIRWFINSNREDPWYEWAPRRDWWIGKMDELTESIANWLSPLIAEGAVGFEKTAVCLEEGSVGIYCVAQANIQLGRASVKVVPKGTLIVGGFGCAELETPLGTASFRLLNLTGTQAADPWKNATWYLVHASSGSPLAPLDRDTFQRVLLDLLGLGY
ncbi:hypothetical protein KPL74_03330 [Bacillus sp. NP157]|nr:hypothetical protein KPL74_03330 [Bacillus sp. NP157]